MKGRRSLNHAKVIASINTKNVDNSPAIEYSDFCCVQEYDASVVSSSCEGTPVAKSCQIMSSTLRR